MTVTKFSAYVDFYAGDVLVPNETSPGVAVKVLKDVYVESVNGSRFIVQIGTVRSGEWKGSTLAGGQPELLIYSHADLKREFTAKWKPGFDVKSGDVLKDKDGVIYLVVSPDMVWNTKTGSHASKTYWEGEGKSFTMVKTTSGESFSKFIKITDV